LDIFYPVLTVLCRYDRNRPGSSLRSWS